MCYTGHYWWMHYIWIFIWVLIIIVFIRLFVSTSKRKVRSNAPFDILMKRFAAGEITKEEYDERKKVIEEDAIKSS